MPVDIESLRASNPLQSVVEQFTGQQIVKHKIFAPWRSESTPSLHVYDDGRWYDFGAGIGGDVIDFLGYLYFGTGYNPETHFTEVVDRLGGLNIKPLPQRTVKPKPEPTKQLSISLETILDWHDTMPANRREYWKSRGLFDQTINDFFLGWDGKRYTIPALYRLVPFAVKRRQSEIDDGIDAKYTSVAGSRSGLFNADCLWATDKVVITEGELDCMTLNQCGIPSVSSTAGAGTFKPEWANLFTSVMNVYLVFDNDKAGELGAQKVMSIIRRAKIVSLPDGFKDVNEFYLGYKYAANWLREKTGCIE